MVGFPSLYQLASRSAFAQAFFAGNRAYFVAVIATIAVLHWSSFVAAMVASRRAGVQPRDLGWPSKSALTRSCGLLVLIGAALVLFREAITYGGNVSSAIQLLPRTGGERSLFVLSALTAGICEEFVYRGFGIRLLQRAGLPTFAAVLFTSAAWVMIHGQVGPLLFAAYLVIGVGFALLFLWRGKLIAPLVVHALLDLAVILAP